MNKNYRKCSFFCDNCISCSMTNKGFECTRHNISHDFTSWLGVEAKELFEDIDKCKKKMTKEQKKDYQELKKDADSLLDLVGIANLIVSEEV